MRFGDMEVRYIDAGSFWLDGGSMFGIVPRTKWDEKMRKIYSFPANDPLTESLAKEGVKPEDIDLVINTHLHFDHAGGNTRLVDGRAVPAFPKAKYVVQKTEMEHALRPTERDRASYYAQDF